MTQHQQEIARYDALIAGRIQERSAVRGKIDEGKERVRRATAAVQI